MIALPKSLLSHLQCKAFHLNGVQTGLKCKPNVKRCKRFVFAAHSPLLHPNTLTTKAISHFQADHILTRFVFPPLQKKIFKKRTGITAFLSKEIFFTTSYNPNKVAETKASNNHIVSNINLSTIQFYKVGYASLRQSILRKKRKRFTACPNRRTIISALPMRYRNPTPASFIYKQDVYQKSGAKIK